MKWLDKWKIIFKNAQSIQYQEDERVYLRNKSPHYFMEEKIKQFSGHYIKNVILF